MDHVLAFQTDGGARLPKEHPSVTRYRSQPSPGSDPVCQEQQTVSCGRYSEGSVYKKKCVYVLCK